MHKIRASLVGAMFALTSLLPISVLADTETLIASAGKQFADEKGAVWLVTDDGCRKAYTSRGAFESFGFNDFKSIKKATTEDLAIPICEEKFILPREGSVVFSSNKEDYGTGYLITNGKKRGFTSFKVFESQGFSGKKRTFADVSFIQNGNPIASETESHPAGTLVDDQGTFKLVTDDGSIGIPNSDTLRSWGYNFSDAVPANSADKQKPESSVLTSRGNGQLNGRELIERCIARQINGEGQTTGGQSVPQNNTGVGSSKPLPSNCPPPPCLRVTEDQNQNQGQGASNKFRPISCGVCEIKSGSVESQTGTVKPNVNKEFVDPAKPQSEKIISPNPPVQVKERPGCLPPPCLYSGTEGSSGAGQPTNIPVPNHNQSQDKTKIKCVPPPCPLNSIENKNQVQPNTSTANLSGQNSFVAPKPCGEPCNIKAQTNTQNTQAGTNVAAPSFCLPPPQCDQKLPQVSGVNPPATSTENFKETLPKCLPVQPQK